MAHLRLGKEACSACAGMGPGDGVGLTVRESQSSSKRPGQYMRPQAVARQHSWLLEAMSQCNIMLCVVSASVSA
jgi:hypothetical protein